MADTRTYHPDYPNGPACAICGEGLAEGNDLAEIYAEEPNAKDIQRLGMESLLVHAECAYPYLKKGWSTA